MVLIFVVASAITVASEVVLNLPATFFVGAFIVIGVLAAAAWRALGYADKGGLHLVHARRPVTKDSGQASALADQEKATDSPSSFGFPSAGKAITINNQEEINEHLPEVRE
jgi:hypothetical protein